MRIALAQSLVKEAWDYPWSSALAYACCGAADDLIEAAWVRFVQRLNASRLGNVTDLGTFLFGQERAALEAQECRCFRLSPGRISQLRAAFRDDCRGFCGE
ncbi:hypothetical protein AYO44_04700 [Planctomycetaceae bacterium SCGC AG-212-F19]|nr:hypothetical protein AYO44_04700 [Planctomycetaceae bacterium SCGC AG-212-F19]